METSICVVGLGYVGLPLALAFSKEHTVIGFDIDGSKIAELKEGIDRTGETDLMQYRDLLSFTSDAKDIAAADFIIVTVPTPIDADKNPDLSCVRDASALVGTNMKKGAVVIYESTVYPGVTEEVCVPILEEKSGMKLGEFAVGYSPERINPGDTEHTIDKITKVVSASDAETLERVATLYSTIVTAGVHKAPSIRTAEAAKVIENIQRDLNIALMNELSIIFDKLDLNTQDVLEAAGTKWNFHKYHPGLVGGHCIGVDPYYLTHKARELGHEPAVILAGRMLNDSMGRYVAQLCLEELEDAGVTAKDSRVLVMGLTFKENVPDSRNSRAIDVVAELQKAGAHVVACEPLLDAATVETKFNVKHVAFSEAKDIDAIILVNAHKQFRDIPFSAVKEKMREPIIIDVKNLWRDANKKGVRYRAL